MIIFAILLFPVLCVCSFTSFCKLGSAAQVEVSKNLPLVYRVEGAAAFVMVRVDGAAALLMKRVEHIKWSRTAITIADG